MKFDMEYSQDEATTRLIDAALDARSNSHSPYSKFRVGAALLTAEGQVFKGCNIESCSFCKSHYCRYMLQQRVTASRCNY
ncbi:hypothetical protein GGH95_000654 [Coemansia sp. RSA 1836]|nr:hypothetical protein GGH95_000654 [Coemansia sp. RSA 1836]